MIISLNGCLKCGGAILLESDQYGEYLSCIQCGDCKDLSIGAPLEKPPDKRDRQTLTGRKWRR